MSIEISRGTLIRKVTTMTEQNTRKAHHGVELSHLCDEGEGTAVLADEMTTARSILMHIRIILDE